MHWNFDHTYARLPEPFFSRVTPSPVEAPVPVLLNLRLAGELGLDPEALKTPEAAGMLAGNRLPSASEPLAQAYAGHQFGSFTLLGDGRAHLLGEHVTPDGRRVDIQLKGSGRTPYSRRGDGRAALGPMLREYLISEAMHGLGIPSTRSLAVVASGEPVMRERALPGAVLTRVAASHIRVGTFQFAALLDAGAEVPGHAAPRAGDGTHVRTLADYTLRRHYPELVERPTRYADLLQAVMERQAALIADWMRVGFVHGVMNTDNMAIAGETIDYGPCAFVDHYDPATVFSSIDMQGRYAFGNQARIAQWNLARFAETLLPLLEPDREAALATAQAMIEGFQALYEGRFQAVMRAKLGLDEEQAGDPELIDALLGWMQRTGADYTNTFRDLCRVAASGDPVRVNAAFDGPAFMDWHGRWKTRLERQPGGADAAAVRMQAANPAVIPRNHRVEEAIEAAVESGDLGPARRLLEVVTTPYNVVHDDSALRQPPSEAERVHQTFCGT